VPNHRDSRNVALLACGVIGPPVFIVVFLIEDAVIRPAGYSALGHPVSGFAIGELDWVQTATFFVTGLLLLGFAVGLRSAPLRRYGGGIRVPVLFGLTALGLA
jgi:hypothetical protein